MEFRKIISQLKRNKLIQLKIRLWNDNDYQTFVKKVKEYIFNNFSILTENEDEINRLIYETIMKIINVINIKVLKPDINIDIVKDIFNKNNISIIPNNVIKYILVNNNEIIENNEEMKRKRRKKE